MPSRSSRPSPRAEPTPAVDATAFARLVADIYRGVGDMQGMRDFLGRAVNLFGAFSGSLVVADRSARVPRFIASHPHFGAAAQSYVDRFQENDPILEAILEAEPARAYVLDELIPPARRAGHPYFTEWAAQNDVGDVLTCRVPCGPTLELMAGFLRSRSAPPFGEAERNALRLLLPHMEQANGFHIRLDRLSVFAAIAQEQMFYAGQGLAVLDEDGRLLFSNRAAGRAIRESGAFRTAEGVLLLTDPDQAAGFEALRQRCAQASAGHEDTAAGAFRLCASRDETLLLSVLPYRPGNPAGFFRDYAARVLLVISKDSPAAVDTRAQLREMFELTAVEAEVFWRIGNGESVEEIAAHSGQSHETVRTRLKRIFTKTGVHRQSDLVRLAMQGMPGWTNPAVVLP